MAQGYVVVKSSRSYTSGPGRYGVQKTLAEAERLARADDNPVGMDVYKYVSKSRKASVQKPVLTNITGALGTLSALIPGSPMKKLLVLAGGAAVAYFVLRPRSASAMELPPEMQPQVYAALPQPTVQRLVNTAAASKQVPIEIKSGAKADLASRIMASRLNVS